MAGNSKDSKILAYKDMINQLNKTISTQTELIQSLQKTLEADRLEKENLRQQIEYLTKKLFGTSSEKRKDIDGQLNLFDEAEQEADPTWKQELPDDITVPEHKRKARRTHADLFKNVPSCDEIISLPEEERNCPTCGTQMECIGKEFVRHEFRFTPAKGKVVNIYRETYKCPECAISEEHPDDQTFVKAPVQEPLIPESYASESVVGWAMHQKYQNGLPLNRQESEWKQLGVPLSRATLANWIIYCTENYLCHVYDYFHRQLRMRKYLMADETRNENKQEVALYRNAPRFVPAGQSTQMIIGATPETDFQIMHVAESLYKKFGLKRVFYSAFVQVNEDSNLPARTDEGPPLLREHRLYQADWLLRYYGFEAKELLSEDSPNFNVLFDPKCNWALKHLDNFPVEVNKADYYTLLRVPGIAHKSASRIIKARKTTVLGFDDLKKMGVVLKRALYFLTCNGKMMYPTKIEEDYITRNLLSAQGKTPAHIQQMTYRQLSLFDDVNFRKEQVFDEKSIYL